MNQDIPKKIAMGVPGTVTNYWPVPTPTPAMLSTPDTGNYSRLTRQPANNW